MEKNKELTPMMEAIEKNRKSISTLQEIKNKTEFERGMLAYAHAIEVDILDLKPKEKQVIEDAYDDGWMNCNAKKYDSGETYYNTKYNNKIK